MSSKVYTILFIFSSLFFIYMASVPLANIIHLYDLSLIKFVDASLYVSTAVILMYYALKRIL